MSSSSSSGDEEMKDLSDGLSDFDSGDEMNEETLSFSHTVVSIIEEKLEEWKRVKMNSDCIKNISELMFQYFTTVHVPDVEAFVNHRHIGVKKKKRKAIPEDVLLCVRKNPKLKRKLREMLRKKM